MKDILWPLLEFIEVVVTALLFMITFTQAQVFKLQRQNNTWLTTFVICCKFCYIAEKKLSHELQS